MSDILSFLENVDRKVAIGILARASISIYDEANPAASYVIENEQQIRENLILAFKEKLGIDRGDDSIESMASVAQAIDSESDRLIGDTNSQAALDKLGNEGDLPSDLYTVSAIPDIVQFHGAKFDREFGYILNTVQNPDREEHFGKDGSDGNAPLISCFSKYFKDDDKTKCFTMLLAGMRSGTNFVVHQAWRIYPDLIATDDGVNLVTILKRFANIFGVEVRVGKEVGKFIYNSDIPIDQEIVAKYEVPDKYAFKTVKKFTDKVQMSFFTNTINNATKKASLVVAINLTKYKKFLKSRGY